MQTTLEPQPDSQRITTVPEDGPPFGIQVATLTSKEKILFRNHFHLRRLPIQLKALLKRYSQLCKR